MLKKALPSRRRGYLALMQGAMVLSAVLVGALALFLIGYVAFQGAPHLTWEFLSTGVSYLDGRIGILPNLLNTLYIIIATLLIVLPLGVGAAVYLNEYAKNKRLVALIEYAQESLSAIPSIIYGLVGMLLFANRMGSCLLAGSLTLAIMNLPTVTRSTQESLKTVPQSYREGAFGLGAGRWRVIRTVVLPGCADGIVTGCILSLGRIMGESAALLFTAGFANTMHGFFDGLFDAGSTLSVALYTYAKMDGEFEAAFAIALVLMILSVGANFLASRVGEYFKRRNRI